MGARFGFPHPGPLPRGEGVKGVSMKGSALIGALNVGYGRGLYPAMRGNTRITVL
jgi:hypothetical protein